MTLPDISECYFCKQSLTVTINDSYTKEWQCSNCLWEEDKEISKYRATYYKYNHNYYRNSWLLCVILDRFYIRLNYDAQKTEISTLRSAMQECFLILPGICDWKHPDFLEKIKLYNLLS